MTAAGAAAPFLAIRSVRRSFGGVHALDDVSLDLWPGEVHVLAGENGSGKSTLIKVIAGVVRPQGGAIHVAGRELSHLTPPAAVAHGIQVIYQDLSLFPSLSVAENLALNTLLEHRRRFVRRRDMREIAARALANLDVDIDLDVPVAALPAAQRQLIAIARALLQDARLVILDEPTTALTSVEVESLFAVVRRLTARGVAMLFVSHKIREMRRISDRFTILRNGRVVDAGPASEFDDARLTHAMTGRTLAGATRRAAEDRTASGPPRLRVSHLEGSLVRDVSLDLRPGEILGVTGLLGAGQAELALMLAGARRPVSGRIELDGVVQRFRNVRDAVRAGVAHVPEDRLREGLFLDQPIRRNITAASLRRLRTRAGLLSRARERLESDRWAGRLDIRAATLDAPAGSLSGGNQQRVVLSKWLATAPKVLVLHGPTVGVDVGAKAAIHDTLRQLAAEGLGIVMVSDDLEELAHHCDRVLVIRRGLVGDELAGDRLTEDRLALL